MPQVIQTAEEIARERGQDILIVDFQTVKERNSIIPTGRWDRGARVRFVVWLDREGIPYQEAYPPLAKGTLVAPYPGTIVIVASEDRQTALYNKIVDEWEQEDGSPKVANITLFIVPKDLAARRSASRAGDE